MSTRGLFGFRKNGIDKVTYNHSDSYPEGLGYAVAEYCFIHTARSMKCLFDKITLVNEDDLPTPEQVEWATNYKLVNTYVGSQSELNLYCLLRNLQGNLDFIDSIVKSSGVCYMIDNSDFIADSLFCEYAYIINLDTETLELWSGFQKAPQKGNRYGTDPDNDGYYPCRLVAEYPLDEIENVDALVQKMIRESR